MAQTIFPYPWQMPGIRRAVQILKERDLLLMMSDTGTGKTVMTLEAMRRLGRRFLVVCPKSVKTAWTRTAEAMNVSGMIGVVNPERLLHSNPYVRNRKQWILEKGATIVYDEVHKGCSGHNTKATHLLAMTKAYGYPVVALSATLADSPLKMRGVGFLAGLHGYRLPLFWDWCRDMGCFVKPGIPGLHFPKGEAGRQRMLELHKALAPCAVRLKFADIPDFPDSVLEVNVYDMSQRDKAEINRIYREMGDAISKGGSTVLTEQLRARQKTELLKVPLLAELIRDALGEGKAPVVFVNFRETLAKLAAELAGVPLSLIYGAQSDRDAQVDAFQNGESRALLAMIQAGGLGLSLHDTSGERPRVSFITPNFSAVEFTQTLGRIRRAGGSPVVQTVVLAAGTIEERIHAALRGKLGNLSALTDGDLTPTD